MYLASAARDACILLSDLAVSFIVPFPLPCFLSHSSLLSCWIPQPFTTGLASLHRSQGWLSRVYPVSPPRAGHLPEYRLDVM